MKVFPLPRRLLSLKQNLSFTSHAMRFPAPFNLLIKRSRTLWCTFLCFEHLWRKPLDGFPQAGGVGSNNWMPVVICYFCLCVPLCCWTTVGLLLISRRFNGQQEGRVCFIYEIKCHLRFDGCLLRESVLIVPYNRVLSFSLGLWPDLPTHTLVYLHTASKTMWCCRASSQGHWGPSPRAALLSDKSVPDLLSELNRSFVVSSMWMSAWLSCGFPHSLCFLIPYVASSIGTPLAAFSPRLVEVQNLSGVLWKPC